DLEPGFADGRQTGRCIVVHEAPVVLGVGAEVAAAVSQRCFFHLEAPVERVGGAFLPYPPNRYEHHYLPDVDRILDAIDRVTAL
ncbi:MAG: transketolase C-terminal domain-containing protein, partial [Candidatus Nanopelagicales bacterium]